ncbi:hypothetical protein HGB07_07000 [Candidatus Roizmanbacteria bacterium]|nr:hypothetical protein [Candidatus Roizmanbacteria bacterium]
MKIITGLFYIMRSIITTEIKIFLTPPLYDDLIGFSVVHRSFWFSLFDKRVFDVTVYINFTLHIIQLLCVTEMENILDVSVSLWSYCWQKAPGTTFRFKVCSWL